MLTSSQLVTNRDRKEVKTLSSKLSWDPTLQIGCQRSFRKRPLRAPVAYKFVKNSNYKTPLPHRHHSPASFSRSGIFTNIYSTFLFLRAWPDCNSDTEASDRGIGALGSPKFATLSCTFTSELPKPIYDCPCLCCTKRNVSFMQED